MRKAIAQYVNASVTTVWVLALLAIVSPVASATEPIQWKSDTVASVSTGAPVEADIGSGAVRHVVVQFADIPDSASSEKLSAAGVHLLNYLGSNAYFAALAPSDDAASAAEAAGLAVAYEIKPQWKAHPQLLKKEYPPYSVFPAPAESIMAANAAEGKAPEVVAVYALFHGDVDVLTTGATLVEQFGGEVRDFMLSINGVVAWLPLENLDAFIAHDSVEWVEPPLPPLEGVNDSNRIITQVDTVNAAPYNLNGAGVNVMVYDGGEADETHPDFGGRLTVRDTSGNSTHAAHVSGTIGGSGANSAAFGGTPNQWRGMAPGVTIQSYGLQYDGTGIFLYTNPGDLEADYDQSINTHGTIIANNSIGTNTAANGFPCSMEGDYGVTDLLIDAIVGGSLGAPTRIVWANGNERGNGRCGTQYLTTAPPACAKNHITVGAMNSNDDSVTTFTSWGPTDDGRMKPDVSAPGCQVGVDNGVKSVTFGGGYTVFCGTSMAAPTTTGVCALLFQDYMAQFPGRPLPRNSTLKILLAHTAQDLGNTGPDYQTGYGSIRAQNAVDFMRTDNFIEAEVSQGQVVSYSISVPAGTTQLKVSMAWDDAPGAVNTIPELVNDLDVTVESPSSTVYFPWTLNPASPETPAIQTQADHANNIEQVVVNSPQAGTWKIYVNGFAVPSGPQTFSLCASPNLQVCSSAGTIALNDTAYTCSDTATIRVSDCDLNQNPSVTETTTINIVSSSEPAGESVLLTETGLDTGVFSGSINLSSTNAAGVLWVSNGDIVTATYNDADSGNGSPAVVTDTASVDCSAPAITNVAVSNVSVSGATVTVTTNEPTSVIVRYGTLCGTFTGAATSAVLNSSHVLNLSGLTALTTYYLEVEASDDAGNMVVDNNGGACYSFTTQAPPDYFTEHFSADDVDINFKKLTFVPANTPSAYSVCSDTANAFPTDPSGGTTLTLTDDSFATVALANPVLLYGTSHSTMYVGSNGYITFGAGDSTFSQSLANHFNRPRISGLYRDLYPPGGGSVSYKQLGDRVAVTWQNVPVCCGTTVLSSFQIEMFFNGIITITWLDVQATTAICGLSRGTGLPADFLESNLSGYSTCPTSLTISGSVTNAGYAVPGVVLNGLPGNPQTDGSGNYSATVPFLWTGTVTPTLAGYEFSPPSRTYALVTSNHLSEDYVALNSVSDKVFSINFESGLGGLVVDNSIGAGGGLWHLTTACASAQGGHSAVTSLYYGLDASCDYNEGNTAGAVLSPVINLTGSTGALLSFAYFLATEGAPASYDQAYVDVSSNGGPFIPVASNNATAGLVPLADPTNGWQTAVVDLSAYTGSEVQLRFRFATIDSGFNANPGFYVDDLMLLADAACMPPGTPTNPTPANGGTNASLDTDLMWASGGAGVVVVPNANEALEGDDDNAWPINLAFGSFPSMRYQQIYSPSEIGRSGVITQIRFRPDGPLGVPFGATNIPMQIHLGYAATTPTTPSTTFANNIGAAYTEVFNGTMTVSSSYSGAGPRDFDIILDVNDVFAYDPSNGPLLVDVRVLASVAATQMDATGFSVPQTGTTRIYSTTDVNAATGVINYTGAGSPYGLVTMLCFNGGVPTLSALGSSTSFADVPVEIDPATGASIGKPVTSDEPVPTVEDNSPATYSAPNALSSVAIFQNENPWGSTANQSALMANGISYAIYSSADMGIVDLSPYDKVIVSSVQSTSFYNTFAANRAWFEAYVSAGGILDIHAASYTTSPIDGRVLPGGFMTSMLNSDDVTVVDSTHPVLTTPNVISAASLDGWFYSSHGYLSTVPPGAHEVIELSSGQPCAMDLAFGAGRIFITLQTLEWPNSNANYLENTILYDVPGGQACNETFDVYFGTSPQAMQPLCVDTTQTICDPGLLMPSTTYYWRVVADNCCGQTAGPVWSFTTSPNALHIVSPDGGEDWPRGQTHTILWNSVGSPGSTVQLQVYKNGVLIDNLGGCTPNDGSFDWLIPAGYQTGNDFRVRVYSCDIPSILDDSDANFSISESCNVTINSVGGTPNPVASGGTVQCSVDVTASGGPLSYQWNATLGSFNDATLPNPIWTAPTVCGGGTVTAVIGVAVTCPGGGDQASYGQDVTPTPSVVSITQGPSANPTNTGCPAQQVQAHVLAEASCGDPVTYLWSDDCGGSFNNPASPDPIWTAPFNPGPNSIVCNLNVVCSAPGATPAQAFVQVTVPPCVQACELRVGDSFGAPGGEVVVPLLIENAPNSVAAFGVDVSFDTTLLTFVSGTAEALTSGWPFLDFSVVGPGVVRVGGFTAGTPIPAGATGQLVLLRFDVSPSATSGDVATLTPSNLVDDIEGWVACAGTFEVGCCRDGDVNLSCSITPGDALLAFQQYLGQVSLTACQKYHADVNAPAEPPQITPGDALCIFQMYLGQPSCIAQFPQGCSCQD